MIRDVRFYFDWYTVQHSSLEEIVEVLRFSHLFSTQCIGRVLRIRAAFVIGARLD